MNQIKQISLTKKLSLGTDKLVFFSGPCAIESESICDEIAEFLIKLQKEEQINIVFKASFDKANRSSINSFRSIGFSKALSILEKIKKKYQIPIMTDIHETWQVNEIKNIIDIIQIPAFLCRQTDLIVSAAQSNLAVNIKKGQFMAAEDMQYVLEKAYSTNNKNIFLTERGTCFGYQNLVVDFRALSTMKSFCPVVYDITHAVQKPGKGQGHSLGDPHLSLDLAKAAASIGVSGFFLEIHPNPTKAKSDAATMLTLKKCETTIKTLTKIHNYCKNLDEL
ncbi:MAG: 3-deoxy-8-phosphooctulonate synthase [bacterium]